MSSLRGDIIKNIIFKTSQILHKLLGEVYGCSSNFYVPGFIQDNLIDRHFYRMVDLAVGDYCLDLSVSISL